MRIATLFVLLFLTFILCSSKFQYIDNDGTYYDIIIKSAFLTYVKLASKLFGNDMESNLKYIQTQMDYQFGSKAFSYVVSIQDQQCKSVYWIQSMKGHYISRKNIN